MRPRPTFFGPGVVRGAFVMAMFGWGVGFYGPPIFLQAVLQRTGWPLEWVSAAVTAHFAFGALVIVMLPRWHRRFGVGPVAVAGALCTSAGIFGWAVACAPWQLFAAAAVSGAGWVTMGAVAVNAAIAPWFARARPVALAKAYNGASIGGVLFSPLWAWLIPGIGFAAAAAVIGLAMTAVMAWLARAAFAVTPASLGQTVDGDAEVATTASASAAVSPRALARPLPRGLPWCDRRFVTLASAMALSLFAQIGLIAHLFSLLVPVFGGQAAAWAMSLATACAIGGRLLAARILAAGAGRRATAAISCGVQLVGTLTLLVASAQQPALILVAVALFGAGIGNATSLPPLIAQDEFAQEDVARVVSLIVALSQATYAFAPMAFGFVLAASGSGSAAIGQGAGTLLLGVALVQGSAILCCLAAGQSARSAR